MGVADGVVVQGKVKSSSQNYILGYLGFTGALPGVVGVIGLVRPSSSIPPRPTNSTTPVTFTLYFHMIEVSYHLLEFNHSGHLIECIHVLFNHQLVISQGNLGCWVPSRLGVMKKKESSCLPLFHLPHKLLQLCSFVLDSFGEILRDVDVASSQKLCLPEQRRFDFLLLSPF